MPHFTTWLKCHFHTLDFMMSNAMHHFYVSKSPWFAMDFLQCRLLITCITTKQDKILLECALSILATNKSNLVISCHINNVLPMYRCMHAHKPKHTTVCVGLWVGVYRVKLQDLLGLYLSDHSYLMWAMTPLSCMLMHFVCNWRDIVAQEGFI